MGVRRQSRAKNKTHKAINRHISMSNLNQHIENVVLGIVAIFVNGCNIPQPSEDTTRCIRIMVRSMFNWTDSNDVGAVGFQIQQAALMLMPDDDQCVVLHLLGNSVNLFMAEQEAHRADCERDRQQRIEAMRQRVAARKATA
jgi:hypothetical protein